MTTDLAVFLSVLALALASMLVFGMTGTRRAPDRLDLSDRGSFVLGAFTRSWLYWFIGPGERLALAIGLGPTAFNLLGVGFGMLAGACFASGLINAGGWAVLLGGLADVFDGRIARARGLASRRGAFLDSTLDRFAEVGAFVGLAVLYRGSALALALVVVALGGSLLVSYARARGESVGVLCKLGVMQRAERLLLVGLGGVLDPSVSAALGRAPGTVLLWIVGLVAAGTLGTAVFRTVWITRRLPVVDE